MDPGSYITNTILINAITSIPYAYLEPVSSRPKSCLALLRRIEASWRGKGALVVCDSSEFGIWLFGSANGDDPYSKVATSCVIDKDGGVETHGLKFSAEARGTFETSALKSPDILQVQGLNKNLSAVPAITIEGFRNAQIMNARAAHINNTASMKQGQVPSPVNAAAQNPDSPEGTSKIRQLYISAVLGTVSHFLCRDSGLIPLNGRTLTSPSRKSMGYECCRFTAPMISLDVALTALGSLTLKATCQASSALSFVNMSPDSEPMKPTVPADELVWLAPGGVIARYLGPFTEQSLGNVEAPLDSAPSNRFVTPQWQQHCRTWLIERGIDASLIENCAWLMVQVAYPKSPDDAKSKSSQVPSTGFEPPLTFSWPAELCFVRQRMAGQIYDKVKATTVNGNSTLDRDPLSFAEQWISTAAEREVAASKKRQDREAEIAAKAQAESHAKGVQGSTYSTAAARRNSVVGGVYPTPPDGVQILPGATPTFDSTSTPGNPNQATPMNGDASIPVKEDTTNDPWNSANVRKETQGSEFPANDESDLFGDMTNDIFGENDITDADFNFFDEPDEMAEDVREVADAAPVNEPQQLPATDPQREAEIPPADNMDFSKEIADTKMMDVGIVTDSPLGDLPPASSQDHPQPLASRGEERLHLEVSSVVKERDLVSTLSPEIVFRRLFPAASSQSVEESSKIKKPRRISQFGAIGFESTIADVDCKYGSNGRFGYDEKSEVARKPMCTTVPETVYLKNHHKRQRLSQPKQNLTNLLSTSLLQSEPNINVDMHADLKEDSVLDSATGSDLSDPDDMSSDSEEFPVGSVACIKRKRDATDDGDDEMTSSFQDLAVESLPSDIDELIPPALDSDAADWPLDVFFNLPQPPTKSGFQLSDSDLIAAAQILTDQVASSTISNMLKDEPTPLPADLLEEKTIVNKMQKELATVAKRCFQNTDVCDLNKFLRIQGFPTITQIMRPSTRPQGQGPAQLHSENPFPIKTPHVEVRRSDSKLTVLPSAIAFWENLGLGPCKGNKDISAVCVFPAGEAMPEIAYGFLKRMKSAYESAKLGSHEKVTDLGPDISPVPVGPDQDIKPGLMSINFPRMGNDRIVNQHAISSTIQSNCRKLGEALAKLSAEERNLVVYFIYPSDQKEILPLICSGFYDLYETYKRSLNDARSKIRNELVLQLIPKRFVTSSTAIVVPSPLDYARLGLEVYDRCTDFQSPSCSPSILLEQPLPKNIEFKVTITPSVSLLEENSCIHVAYAQSIDDRWISAAWTDNRGSEQMTASYCLGRKNQRPSRTFSEIANEIWETTLDIISCKAVNWRIMIAKSGVMDRSEIDCWTNLASTEPSASVTLTLLTIKSRPSLQLLPRPTILSPAIPSSQSAMLTTPVSTPQSLSVVSPDQTTNAPTPEPNPSDPPPQDATLIDITDQTWGSVLSHRLNNSNSLLDNNPSLLSGYLIKRSGARPEDVPILLEINIVGVGVGGNNESAGIPGTNAAGVGGSGINNNRNNTRACEHLLREVMGMYRALGTLARVRGVVDSVRDARPWHIAAVEKAVEALYALM